MLNTAIEAYGLRINVRTQDLIALRLVRERFPFGWRTSAKSKPVRDYSVDLGNDPASSRSRRMGRVDVDGIEISRTRDTERLLDTFETDIRMYVAEHGKRRVFVHAGVVGWKGRAIMIPGSSFSGKTTLVTELVRAGASYYSDEYAVLDPQGRVHPFAQPLSIRDPEQGLKQIKWPIEALGGKAGRKALPLGLVVICHRDGKKWRPRRLTAGVGALGIMAHAVAARTDPARALQTIRTALSRAVVVESSRAEARDAVAGILKYSETVDLAA